MSPARLIYAAVPGGASPAGKAWLVTFTDLVCLMLTFFVMLFAMSEPDTTRLKAMAGGGDAPLRRDGAEQPLQPLSAEGADKAKAIDLGYLGRVLDEQMRGDPALAGVVVARRDRDLVLVMPADLLFAPGSAEIAEAGRDVLFALGGVVRNLGNAVEVVGFGDPAEPVGAVKSTWELSLSRAGAVAASLRAAGYLRDMTIRGHADGRNMAGAADIDAGSVEDQARFARRVDVVIRDFGGAR